MKIDEINPEERKFKRAAGAEKAILAILMHDSQLFDKVKEILTPDDFITSFHKRVYESISQVLERTPTFDITMISGDFSPEEMGRIVMINTNASVYKNSEAELNDCIEVLRVEREKSTKIDAENLNDEDFASLISKIGKSKK